MISVDDCEFRLQFSRTVAPETSKGAVMLAFMRHNRWKRAIVLTSTDSVWFESGRGLANQFEEGQIEVFKPAAFEPRKFNDLTLQQIKQSGIRIVVVLADDADARAVAMQASKVQVATAGWAWMLPHDSQAVFLR